MKLKLFPIIGLFLVFSLVAVAPPLVRTASAAATLTSLSVTTGPVGTTVTVTGTVAVGNNYEIRWDNAATGLVLAPSTPSGAGGAVSRAVVIPGGVGGVHTVILKDQVDSTTSAAAFTITPATSIDQVTGFVGETIVVSGTGFAASEGGVVITWDGTVLADVGNADAVGSWAFAVGIPPSSGGPHTVASRGFITTAAGVVFTTLASMNISPASGKVGTQVTVKGFGFAAAEAGIQVNLDEVLLATVENADFVGSWTATVTIPPATGGVHTIVVTGTTTAAMFRIFTLFPGIEISPASGPAGTEVTVKGTGFSVLETEIAVTWDGTVLASAVGADFQGSWTATVTVPASAGGSHTLGAYGLVTSLISQAFTVLPTLDVSPTSGLIGTLATVKGTGYGTGENSIEILWDGIAVQTGIIASQTGAWSGTFSVPPSAAGNHIVSARGPVTSASQVTGRSFTITRRLVLTPTSGYPGLVVTIEGAGFATNSAVSIYYDGTKVTTTPSQLASTATGSVSATFSVPASGPGAHVVVVSDDTGTVEATFTVTSSVSSTPASGTVGSQATISGLGFPPNSTVAVAFDGAALSTTPASVSTDASGAFTARVVIPEAARGKHTVKVTSGLASMTTSFDVSPTLSVTPESGVVGAVVTVTGKGFGSGQRMAFTVDGSTVETPLSAPASPSGSFTTTIVLPNLAGGAHTIKASDGTASAQASVAIISRVAVSTNTAKVGDRIKATGTGFPAGTTVAVAIDGAAAATAPSPLRTDSLGSFAVEVTVQDASFGSHTLSFTGGSSTAQASFSVSSSFSIFPDNGNVDTVVTVTGTGYASNSPVSVTYDGSSLEATPAPLTSSARGSFQATVKIPRSAHGQHVVAVRDAAGNTGQGSFTMESTPPPVASPVSPTAGSRVGTFGSQQPTFSWSSVSDPSGVTYSLQVSSSADFSTLVLEKTGLTTTSYKLSGDEKLKRGSYFWRVKVVDGASNESNWSQAFSFKVGLLPSWIPRWLFPW